MSTRGCIARLTSKPGKDITFRGVWAHWDNYPSAVGSTLFQIRNGHFKKDTKAMLDYLIDAHRSGWSTINNCDFNLPAAPRPDSNLVICTRCRLPNWRHYAQNYVETFKLWIEAGRPVCPPRIGSTYLVSDHSPELENLPHGPECYPENQKEKYITHKNASACGCEYVYAFTKNGKTMLVLSSYCGDEIEGNPKMIGFFGQGDKNATWKIIGLIDLDGQEPTEEQWGKIPIEQVTSKMIKEQDAKVIAEKKKLAKKEKEQRKLNNVFNKSGLAELMG